MHDYNQYLTRHVYLHQAEDTFIDFLLKINSSATNQNDFKYKEKLRGCPLLGANKQPVSFSLLINNSATLGKIKMFQ